MSNRMPKISVTNAHNLTWKSESARAEVDGIVNPSSTYVEKFIKLSHIFPSHQAHES